MEHRKVFVSTKYISMIINGKMISLKPNEKLYIDEVDKSLHPYIDGLVSSMQGYYMFEEIKKEPEYNIEKEIQNALSNQLTSVESKDDNINDELPDKGLEDIKEDTLSDEVLDNMVEQELLDNMVEQELLDDMTEEIEDNENYEYDTLDTNQVEIKVTDELLESLKGEDGKIKIGEIANLFGLKSGEAKNLVNENMEDYNISSYNQDVTDKAVEIIELLNALLTK